MSYTVEHGDLLLLNDRKELAFNLGGTSYTVHPTPQYTVGQSGAVKGYALAIDSSGHVVYATSGNTDKCIGLALTGSTVTSGSSTVEVLDHGLYTWAGSTPFSSSDWGKTAYINPLFTPASPTVSSQFTTDRLLASTGGGVLIEVGIVVSNTSLFIDFEGDTRGAVDLTQIALVSGEAITTSNYPKIVSQGTDGKIYLADRRKAQNGSSIIQRNNPCGFLIGAVSGYSTTVSADVNCIIQKAGVLGGLTGLTQGKPIYLDINGTITQNLSTMSYYDDVMTPLGFAISSTRAYLQVGFNTQTSDANDIGAIIATNPTHVADYGYLLTVGSAMNTTGTTHNPTGQVAGDYDGTSLFTKIGISYGGTLKYSISNLPPDPTLSILNLNINGVSHILSGDQLFDIPILATEISLLSVSGFTMGNPTSGVFSMTSTGNSIPIITSDCVGLTFTRTGGTYNLPNVASGGNPLQIKYNNWYMANPTEAPLYRYDTGWTTWGSVPAGSTGNLTSTPKYLDIPINSFGYDPDITDIFVEVYVQQSGQPSRLIDPKPIVYTWGQTSLNYKEYGYDVSKSESNKLKISFAKNNLAYYNTSGSVGAGTAYTEITSAWQYKILIYKTERFNKFYDYTSDQWLNQFKSLNVVDYTLSTALEPSRTSGGYLYKPTTSDTSAYKSLLTHTSFLAYDGYFATNNLSANEINMGNSTWTSFGLRFKDTLNIESLSGTSVTWTNNGALTYASSSSSVNASITGLTTLSFADGSYGTSTPSSITGLTNLSMSGGTFTAGSVTINSNNISGVSTITATTGNFSSLSFTGANLAKMTLTSFSSYLYASMASSSFLVSSSPVLFTSGSVSSSWSGYDAYSPWLGQTISYNGGNPVPFQLGAYRHGSADKSGGIYMAMPHYYGSDYVMNSSWKLGNNGYINYTLSGTDLGISSVKYGIQGTRSVWSSAGITLGLTENIITGGYFASSSTNNVFGGGTFGGVSFLGSGDFSASAGSFYGTIVAKATYSIQVLNDSGYIAFWNTANTIRNGYIQGLTSTSSTGASSVGLQIAAQNSALDQGRTLALNPNDGRVTVGNIIDDGVNSLQVNGGILSKGGFKGPRILSSSSSVTIISGGITTMSSISDFIDNTFSSLYGGSPNNNVTYAMGGTYSSSPVIGVWVNTSSTPKYTLITVVNGSATSLPLVPGNRFIQSGQIWFA